MAEKLYNIAYVKLEYDEEKANKVLQETFSIACMKIDVLYYSEYPFAWLLQVQSFVILLEDPGVGKHGWPGPPAP